MSRISPLRMSCKDVTAFLVSTILCRHDVIQQWHLDHFMTSYVRLEEAEFLADTTFKTHLVYS